MYTPYEFGSGKLYFRPAGEAAAAWQSFGDLSALSLSAAPLAGGRSENWSGNRGRLPGQPLAGTLSLSVVLHRLTSASLAELVSGAVDEQASGAVSNYTLPHVAPGVEVRLPHLCVADVVVTDSASTPATIAPEHYTVQGAWGAIEIVSLPEPAPTQPLHVAYSHLAAHQVGLLTQAPRLLELRYEGVNIAAGNAPFVLELWRVEIARLKDLVLLDSQRRLAGVPLSGDVLLDTSRAQPGMLGGFGRFTQAVIG